MRRFLVRMLIVASMVIMVETDAARATFPGANGRIAYVNTAAGGSSFRIALTGSGPLTFTSFPDHDFDPAFSPDGSQVAFKRQVGPPPPPPGNTGDDQIMVVRTDGTGLRLLVDSNQFHENARIGHPSWSRDGSAIAYAVHHIGSTNAPNDGIWSALSTSEGFPLSSQVVQGYADFPSWSPVSNTIVYVCRFRTDELGRDMDDLCITDAEGVGLTFFLPIDWPGRWTGAVAWPKFTPDGTRIVFTLNFSADGPRTEIFQVLTDGTGLSQLTTSPLNACGQGSFAYSAPTPSPDGGSIVAVRGPTDATQPCLFQIEGGSELVTLSAAHGGVATPLPFGAAYGYGGTDWQPSRADLSVNVQDGHGHPLQGLNVELRTTAGAVVPANPTNIVGDYLFDDVAPGEYKLRATLIDNSGGAGSVPAFDIRHAPNSSSLPAGPGWVEVRHTQNDSDSPHFKRIIFGSHPDVVGSNVVDRTKLDDMANIYYRLRQFVEWVKVNLTEDTGNTVEVYTFATSATPPWGGQIDWSTAAAAYSRATTAVAVGARASEYQDGDARKTVEWHEFTHHVYMNSVSVYQCGVGSGGNHGGYNLPSTCDSMQEGIADFLPSLAAQEIDATASTSYKAMGSELDKVKFKPWGHRKADGSFHFEVTDEDMSVAGLFWDLVDSHADSENTAVIGADGLHTPIHFIDTIAIPISEFWDQLTASNPETVRGLRSSFGDPSLTEDLDGDDVPDVAPIDEVFLLHGFFPIDGDQTITGSHKTYHYDVDYSQGDLFPRNFFVGMTSHYVYDEFGSEIDDLVNFPRGPRFAQPPQPHAYLEINVVNPGGNGVSGATLDMTIRYPGGQESIISRGLGTGNGVLVPLELPPYFDYLLPVGASLPPCDPAHDYQVQVTLRARVNGTYAAETPSFDNCTYLHAMEAASGPAALSFTWTFDVPERIFDDNCPLVDNPDQLDSGGINTTVPDGIGDACQCGDVTGNGIVNGEDAQAIRRFALRLESPTYGVPGNCDVTGNGACNGQDANAVQRAALGTQPNPTFGQNCQNANPNAPPCSNCEP